MMGFDPGARGAAKGTRRGFALFRVISTAPGRTLDRHPEPSAAITPERRMSLKRFPWVFHRGALMCMAKPRAAAKAGTWRPDVECSTLLWNIWSFLQNPADAVIFVAF